jgi:hypothetical protein
MNDTLDKNIESLVIDHTLRQFQHMQTLLIEGRDICDPVNRLNLPLFYAFLTLLPHLCREVYGDLEK